MKRILVIGASGFVGGAVARALLAEGYRVRCLARNPARVTELAAAGCEIVQGDLADAASIEHAFAAVDAAYIAIHTLSPQHADTAGQGFMDVEMNGLRNVVAACQEHGTRRLLYVTSLGIAADAPGVWLRERWNTEQFLFASGLDVTVLRPGMIVGAGGRGFEMMLNQARRPFAINFLGNHNKPMRVIALDDLVYYLLGVLEDTRTYGKTYDVGSDDVLTNDQMIDRAADALGRKHPRKLRVPPALLSAMAPWIERLAKVPKGAIRGILDSLTADASGNPGPIRLLLPRPLLDYQQALKRAAS